MPLFSEPIPAKVNLAFVIRIIGIFKSKIEYPSVEIEIISIILFIRTILPGSNLYCIAVIKSISD